MAGKAQYRTRQGDELLQYLKSCPGMHLTAAQIRAHLEAAGTPLGMATVYRHMDKLVQDGLARRYTLDAGDGACYEYVGEDPAQDCTAHFHCKCERCGALIHLDCDELQAIHAHLLSHHGFAWNAGKTVFYGICQRCRDALRSEADS